MGVECFPWLWPFGEGVAYPDRPTCESFDVCSQLTRLRSQVDANVPCFVPSEESLGALAYELRVWTGAVPTRNMAHDWYNGLVWLAFPEAKQAINLRHVAAGKEETSQQTVNARQSRNGRSRQRDALTLFDENGAILLTTNPDFCQALLDHDWAYLFEKQEMNWEQQAKLLLFGHGLLDSLHVPYKGLCAKAVPVHVPSLQLDSAVLREIMRQVVMKLQDPANLNPLPVMGIPGWFAESKNPEFYRDSKVYRAKPTRHLHSFHKRLAFHWDGNTLRDGKCAGQSLPEFQGEESPDSSEHGAG